MHQLYLRGIRCVQDEVRELFKHLVESSPHLTLRQHLPRKIRQQAGGQFSVARLAFEGQGHGQRGELVLVLAQIELLQQHLIGFGGRTAFSFYSLSIFKNDPKTQTHYAFQKRETQTEA